MSERYRRKDNTESLSFKIRIRCEDEFDSAWYALYFSAVENIETQEDAWAVRIYITNYEGTNQYGPPVQNYILPTASPSDAVLRTLNRFLEDLSYRPHDSTRNKRN